MTNTGPDYLVHPFNVSDGVEWLEQYTTLWGITPESYKDALVEIIDEELRRNGETAEAVRSSVKLLDELAF